MQCCDDYYFSKCHDNLNLSPGMKSIVFCKEPSQTENASPSTVTPTTSTVTASEPMSTICMREKVWGIVPRSGTRNMPLDEGPALHFSNMMYNARSDTLYEKIATNSHISSVDVTVYHSSFLACGRASEREEDANNRKNITEKYHLRRTRTYYWTRLPI